ncbi:hypothetical protein V7S43_010178 [Phytophthora oleae]|uniref:RxLR effector protein n=1 Tax=Phytophthora oleae TaxID=2107226 RepID=A0ABD3FE22_9STRA
MRLSQFLLFVIVAFAYCSAVTTAENANLATFPSREAVGDERRFLKGSKTTTDLDAAGEKRVGATTPSFKQYLGWIKLPSFSKMPGIEQLRSFFKGLRDKRLAKLREKMQNNPNAHGF